MSYDAPPVIATATRQRRRILIRGAVQGVGFRPFVYELATALDLAGWVSNTTAGVTIEVEGEASRITNLIETIHRAPPPNAAIAAVESADIAAQGDCVFEIRASVVSGSHGTDVPVDTATCDDCLHELFDPADRRYRYPFINCTHCGPRYSLIEDMPYDRSRTSMRHFAMCPACRKEYGNPASRRFHAEPNACPVCGPRLTLWNADGTVLASDHDALLGAARAIRQGRIVAIKGVGGFHLFADARNEAAVRTLRARKCREEKPFAVMFPSIDGIAESCRASPAEVDLLRSPAHPIVLSRRREHTPIAASVAPGNPWLGALLPYAPVHHLLMRELGFPVVATSGNRTGEPLVIDENAVRDRLAGIADLFLVHDRPIAHAIDDSVARIIDGDEVVLRRARGYASRSIMLGGMSAGIVARGGYLKNTIALTRTDDVVLSPHIGDLDAIETRAAHDAVLNDHLRLHAVRPTVTAVDSHPDQVFDRAADAAGVPTISVQHHVAHVVACMAENGLTPPVLGVAWDGAGFGMDGTIWGGEFLAIGPDGWRRVAHLRQFRLPGGDAASREPRRAALGLLYEALGDDVFGMTHLAPVAAFSAADLRVLATMLRRGVNAPYTSSAGRLFDAFASLCNLRQRTSYEGQAAMALEGAASDRASGDRYDFPLVETDRSELVIDWKPALLAALKDLLGGASIAAISEALHAGLGAAIAAVAVRLGERRVVLSGGCFQNARLTEAAIASLRAAGIEPVRHRRVPPNDGGLALGQAVWAAWSMQRGER